MLATVHRYDRNWL